MAGVITCNTPAFYNSNEMNTDALKGTQMFPPELYSNLPSFLKLCTDKYTEPRDKDILLSSLLPVVGICLPNIQGLYGTDKLAPTLYMLITAPAASNKGIMKYARLLAQPLQEKLLQEGKEHMRAYTASYKEWQKRKKMDPTEPPPVKPPLLALMLPGNTTSAAFYSLLHDNNGRGFICETEADSISNSLHGDYGNFSDVLRKAYQHETLSLTRKGNNEYYEIKFPQLSILLTGTPEQVVRLIPSTENGLFSRFSFYCYKQPLVWRSVKPCYDCEDLDSFFLAKGQELLCLSLEVSNVKPEFFLSDAQFDCLNAFFEAKVEQIRKFEGEEAASSVHRLGIIAFRIAMILSVLRQHEQGAIPPRINCQNVDLTTALQLAEVYFEHTMLMFSQLPRASKSGLKAHLRKFYEQLPVDEMFTRKKANEIGNQIGIAEKSVNNYLQELVELGHLQREGHGKYLKEEQVK